MRAETKIALEEWLAELERLQAKPNHAGHTTRELAQEWKCSERLVKDRLRTLLDAGRLSVGTRAMRRIDGRPCPIPTYLLIKGKKR